MIGKLRFIWRVLTRFVDNDLHNHAAEMAYFAMMSTFPFLLLLTTAITWLPGEDLLGVLMDYIHRLAPSAAADLVESTIRNVSIEGKVRLFSVTAVTCVWMSLGAMGSTIRGLNKAFGMRDPRHYARFFGLSLLLIVLLGACIVLAVLIVVLSPIIHRWVDGVIALGWYGDILFTLLRYSVAVLCLALAHAGIYWLCPAVPRRFKLFSPGTVFSVTAWVVTSYGLQTYLRYFNTYDRIYGSLGAVIITLFWFYLMSLLLLVGGQIDAILRPATASAAPRPIETRPDAAPQSA